MIRLVLADVRERTRRYSFVVTLLFTLYAAYMFTPPNDAQYATLQMAGHRGIYNSAWIGSLVAMMATLFLSLAGFFLVKNSITRDRQTGVGQILAASRLSTFHYILSKGLSNAVALGLMLLGLMIGAGAMQYILGEDLHIEIWKLCSPFLFIALPTIVFVGALAVLFEAIRPLRGGLGNVIFFFLWMFSVSGDTFKASDIFGIDYTLENMTLATHQAYPDYDVKSGAMSMGFNIKDDNERWHLKTFRWRGAEWSMNFAARRLGWIGFALGILGVATFCFDRFDSSLLARRATRKRKLSSKRHQIPIEPIGGEEEEKAEPRKSNSYALSLARILATSTRFRFSNLLLAEIKLMLNGVSKWWLLVAVGLIIAGALTPAPVSRGFILPFAWIWPILLWSPMGTREIRHRTHQMLFSAPHSLSRQLPAMWLSGVLIALITGSGVAIQCLLQGDVVSLGAWCVGAMFVPTLALTMGVWTGSSKMFEIIYLILWYMGPMNRFPALDFLGASSETILQGIPVIYAGITLTLLFLAILGRKRQLCFS